MTKQEYFEEQGFRGFKPIPDGDEELDDDFKENVDMLVELFSNIVEE